MNKKIIPELAEEQIGNLGKTRKSYRRKLIIIAVSIIVVLALGAGAYYIAYITEESGAADPSVTWTGDIVIDGETVQVKMTFYNNFEHNKTDKKVELIKTDYEYSSSDGKADIYFSDIKITSDYNEASFFSPAEYTSTLTFKCNGKLVTMEQYCNSNGKGGNKIID